MPGIQAEAMGDLIRTTQNELGEMKWTDISTDLIEHVALSKLMKANKIEFSSGPQVQWDLMVDYNHSTRAVGLYASDVTDVPDVMAQGMIPWRHVTGSWAIDRREIAMNRTPRRIIELVKTRRIASLIGMAEYMEDRIWRVPAPTDTLNFFGIPYWITKSATPATQANNNGFNGTAPAGYSSVGGVSPTTYPRWSNYTDIYTTVSKDDLVRKLRRAMTMTAFKPPAEGIPDFSTGNNYGVYTNYAVLGTLEEMLEAQNDNLGNDVASMDGKVMFRRNPVEYIPKLDDDTTDPVYGVNWGDLKIMGLRGEWLNETVIAVQPGQHTVSATHVDTSLNLISRNRRKHFVLAKAVGLPA